MHVRVVFVHPRGKPRSMLSVEIALPDVEELHNRARPPVDDEQREGVLATRAGGRCVMVGSPPAGEPIPVDGRALFGERRLLKRAGLS